METIITSKKYSATKITEEVLSSAVHGLAAIASMIGLVLGLRNQDSASAGALMGFVVYGVSLALLMIMSSLYHALIFTRARRVFQILDHSAIFLLIAGSYTPFSLHLFSGWQRYAVLIGIWSVAITGVVLKATLSSAMKRIGVGLYIAFGWVALLFAPRVSDLEGSVATLLVMGGVLYTLGAIFLAFKKPFFHFVWHIMVILAALSHYFAIVQLL